MISFACPHCLKSYSVPDHQAGRKTRCRQCRESLVVPAAPVPAPAPWKPDAGSASDGTAERAKTPTDADLVLPLATDTPPPEPQAPAEGAHTQEFVVQLEFSDDPGPDTPEAEDLFNEARRFLADVVYAYRHRLAPNGAKLTKVRVDGVERKV